MNKTEKVQRIVLIFLAALTSGYFMYSGFSMLFDESEQNSTITSQGIKSVK